MVWAYVWCVVILRQMRGLKLGPPSMLCRWQAVDPGVAVLAVCTLQLLSAAAVPEAASAAPAAPAEVEPAPSSPPASCGATQHADDCPFRPAESACADAASACDQASRHQEQAHSHTASALGMAEILYEQGVLRYLERHMYEVALDQQPSAENLSSQSGAAEAVQALQAVSGICQAALEGAVGGSGTAAGGANPAPRHAASRKLLPSPPLLEFVAVAATAMLDFAVWHYTASVAALETPGTTPADHPRRPAAAAEQRKRLEQMQLAPSWHLTAAACSLLSWLLVSEHPCIRAPTLEGGNAILTVQLLYALRQLAQAPWELHDTALMCCSEGLSALSAEVNRSNPAQALASPRWDTWQELSQVLERQLLDGPPSAGHSGASAPAQQGAADLRRAVGAQLSGLKERISQSLGPQSGTGAGDGSANQLTAPPTQSAAPATAASAAVAASIAADAAMAELLREEGVRAHQRNAPCMLAERLMMSCRAPSLLRRSASHHLGVRDISSVAKRVARHPCHD